MATTLMPTTLDFLAPVSEEAGHNTTTDLDPSLFFFPGIYCPSGFDLMKILYYVATRPNPTIDLGPVDASCPIVLCDLFLPDHPIVYASASFLDLTGYSLDEVLGRSCQFLQCPSLQAEQTAWEEQPQDQQEHPGRIARSVSSPYAPMLVCPQLHQSVKHGREVQVEVTNFRKDGTPFVNFLSVVPICWDDNEGETAVNGESQPYARPYRYSVAFHCDKNAME
ncbi:hypothetical protein SEUCBS139899_003468 [Sporothrix eucalyptigena]|uniref:PAS domain-containing protein n=1 Tax=Sporothrix eucalyptigena TaxID=1812306 RepID=A0ABP0AP95_9PEZI